MRALSILALMGAVVFVSLGFDHDEDPMSDMNQYWLGLIHKGEAWSADRGPEAMDLQRQHLEVIGRLMETGQMVLAGPCGDDGDLRGLFIYDVPTREHAEKLVQMDPAVRSGHLRVELIPWWGTTALRGLVAASGDLHEHDDDHGEWHEHDGDDDLHGHDGDDDLHGHDDTGEHEHEHDDTGEHEHGHDGEHGGR